MAIGLARVILSRKDSNVKVDLMSVSYRLIYEGIS
jgi:hypothetical protein